MKKKILTLFAVLLILLFSSLALAVDWSPQGNISLKGIYLIKNWPISNCTSGDYVSGISSEGQWICGTPAGGGGGQWNITGSVYLYNNSNILDVNETKLNATISALDTDTNLSESDVEGYINNSANAYYQIKVNQSNYWDNLDSPLSTWLDTYNSTYDAKVSDNTSWNETRANALYSLVSEPLWSGNYSAFNTSWSSIFNSTYDAKVSDNTSWNQTYANTLYSLITEPRWAANYTAFNASWSITFNSTYDAKVSDNTSWNETRANTLYHLLNNLNSAWTGTLGGGNLTANTVGTNQITNGTIIQQDLASAFAISLGNITNPTNCTAASQKVVGKVGSAWVCGTDLFNTSAQMVTAINVSNAYYQILSKNSTGLNCANCIGGTEIDESALVAQSGWYNSTAQIKAAVNDTANAYFQIKSNESRYIDCAGIFGGVDVDFCTDAEGAASGSNYWQVDATWMWPNTTAGGKALVNVTTLNATNIYKSGVAVLTAEADPLWGGNYTAVFNWNKTYADTLYSTIAEPLWSGNYSLFNASWSSTFNATYDAYTDTKLTEEEVEDFVGGMLGGTETGINVAYQDATNDIDFTFDCSDVAGDGLNCDGENLVFECTDVAGEGLSCFDSNIVINLDVTGLDWANDWKMIYSDASVLQELAFGASGTFLMSNGASSAPTWEVADNTSWNETRATAIFSLISEPRWAANYSAFNTSWTNTYNATYDAKVSDNTSWNETRANTLYSLVSEPRWAANYSAFNTSWSAKLTEDEVEAYIFDADNTANFGMGNYNITAVSCILFQSGGMICSD